MNESQRRAYAALGIGPAWRMRRGESPGGEPPGSPASADPAAMEHPPEPAGGRPAVPAERPAQPVEPPAGGVPSRAASIAAMDWAALRASVEQCQACGLSATRQRTVFGVGDPHAGWMLIGEAPGAEEDRRGEPFVGNAGRLLDAMLAALGLERGRGVFIANTLKCRPPNNRDPSPEELRCCAPYLQRQITLVEPRVIVALGRIAAQALLQTEASIASLRGRVHAYRLGERSIPLVVTYHPAYLLRSLHDKGRAWADLCLARTVHDGHAGDPERAKEP